MDLVPAADPTYRYRCTVGGETIAFNSASGLELSVETIEYKDGAGNWFQMPGQSETTQVTLRRGEPGSVKGVWAEWTHGINSYTVEKQDISISLVDDSGTTPLVTWRLSDAFPTKVSASDRDSDGTHEFEEVHLMATRLTVVFS